MIAAIHLTLGQVAATLALVAVAALVSVWQRADLERDIAVATVRSFVQLTAIGYVIKLIFDQNRIAFVIVQIAATLALGATASQVARPVLRRSLRSGMIPLIDSTKTTGLIFFPGTMVGMLLAGAAPIDAVRLQLILLYVLLGSVALAALTAVMLAYRNFFTPAHQLREPGWAVS